MNRRAWVLGVAALASVLLVPAAMAGSKVKTTNFGAGIKIDLSKDWFVFRMPGSMMQMQGMESAEWRADNGATEMAATYLLIVGSGAPADETKAAEQIDRPVQRGAAQYLPAATEKEIAVTRFANGPVFGGYTTLHARPGASFPVLPGKQFSCVTVAIAHRGDAQVVISLASQDCASTEHLAGIAAIAGLHG